MAKIGLFYGSNDGHTEAVADRIKAAFDAYEADMVSIANIAHCGERPPSAREILRGAGIKTRKEVDATLAALLDDGVIEIVERKSNGRPAHAYRHLRGASFVMTVLTKVGEG